MDKLELLRLSKDFEVQKQGKVYEVYCKNSDLEAFIREDGEIHYYVGGVYNSGSASALIEMDKLQELVKFCELMVK